MRLSSASDPAGRVNRFFDEAGSAQDYVSSWPRPCENVEQSCRERVNARFLRAKLQIGLFWPISRPCGGLSR